MPYVLVACRSLIALVFVVVAAELVVVPATTPIGFGLAAVLLVAFTAAMDAARPAGAVAATLLVVADDIAALFRHA